MTWFKVDDGFNDHPKVRGIPRARRAAAVGLWTMAGSWSSKHLTEGVIPGYMLDEVGCTKAQADALVDAGLWHRSNHTCHDCPPVASGSYVFHGWIERNPSRSQVERDREASAERQRRAREKRRQQSIPEPRTGDAQDEREASVGDAQALREARAGRAQGERGPRAGHLHDDMDRSDQQVLSGVTHVSQRDALTVSQRPDPTRPDPTRSYLDDTQTSPSVTRANGRADDPRGTDGHQRHRYHENAKQLAIRWCAERHLPLEAGELLAWMYRLGNGDPWQGRLLTDQATSAQLDTANAPERALRQRLRESARRVRKDDTPPFGLVLGGVS